MLLVVMFLVVMRPVMVARRRIYRLAVVHDPRRMVVRWRRRVIDRLRLGGCNHAADYRANHCARDPLIRISAVGSRLLTEGQGAAQQGNAEQLTHGVSPWRSGKVPRETYDQDKGSIFVGIV